MSKMIRDNLPQNQQQVNPSASTANIQSNSQYDWSIGLQELDKYCKDLYQPLKPLCFCTNKSFIKEGGSNPLEYIYIYPNEGDPALGIPRHWHYIGFGLSDIHGYGALYWFDVLNNRGGDPRASPFQQIYPLPTSQLVSGFGIELTFRIKCNSDDDWKNEPPKWPGLVMQALAKYVFKSKNVFNVGDHTAWNCSLDGEDGESESLIRHMLMTPDPQLNEVQTTFGKIKFIQLVGVCQEELQAAREWNVKGILDIMKKRSETGGEYLVTDMTRGQTIFQLDPDNYLRVNEGISMGSDMTSISARHKYCSSLPKWFRDAEVSAELDHERNHDDADPMDQEPLANPGLTNQIPGVERGNFSTMSRENTNSMNYSSSITRNPSRMSYESESGLLVENLEMADTRIYDNLYLLLDFESARLLPTVLERRLAYRRPFHYKSPKGDLLTTLVPERCETECLVNEDNPFVRRGVWLQIYVCENLLQQMLKTLKPDLGRNLDSLESESDDFKSITLPKNYSWPEFKLHITVVDQIKDSSEGE